MTRRRGTRSVRVERVDDARRVLEDLPGRERDALGVFMQAYALAPADAAPLAKAARLKGRLGDADAAALAAAVEQLSRGSR